MINNSTNNHVNAGGQLLVSRFSEEVPDTNPTWTEVFLSVSLCMCGFLQQSKHMLQG